LLLDLQGLSRRYGSFVALHELTLALPTGRIGLLGPNGAGKSTLLKILLGLLEPSGGSGKVLGLDVASGGKALRRVVGWMPEADGLVPGLSGVDYVTLAGELCGMPRREAKRRAHEMLTYLELEDARYRALEEYSTGMKQRIKLAQALVHDPPLLLLDEPTSGLDPAGRDGMLNLLRRIGEDFNKSLILCTHLLGDVERVCSTVLIMHRGRLLRQGTPAQLCNARHDRFVLEMQGEGRNLRTELQNHAVQILEDNLRGRWRVQVPGGWVVRQFFELAQKQGVVLTGVQSDNENLEELFHRVLEEAENQS
jgi:ABC-2 type transport system ATP-binding protein